MSEHQLAIPESQQLTTKAAISMGETGVQLASFDEMARFCKAVFDSGLAPKGFPSPQAVMVAVQMGLEVGFKPLQALQSIGVINGKPCIYGDGALALVRNHPAFEDITEAIDGEGDKAVATCTVKRRDQTPVTRTFSYADAKKAGLIGKAGPWTQYEKRMLQMRARSFAMRDAFADALRGLSVREEVEDYAKPAKAREVTGLVLPDEVPQRVEVKTEAAV